MEVGAPNQLGSTILAPLDFLDWNLGGLCNGQLRQTLLRVALHFLLNWFSGLWLYVRPG